MFCVVAVTISIDFGVIGTVADDGWCPGALSPLICRPAGGKSVSRHLSERGPKLSPSAWQAEQPLHGGAESGALQIVCRRDL
jgi:hypothetical protein